MQALPFREIPHHVHPWGRHPQQEEGALLILQAQEKAHLGSQEKQILAESHIFILVLKTLCIDQFYFLDIIVVFAWWGEIRNSGVAINKIECFCFLSLTQMQRNINANTKTYKQRYNIFKARQLEYSWVKWRLSLLQLVVEYNEAELGFYLIACWRCWFWCWSHASAATVGTAAADDCMILLLHLDKGQIDWAWLSNPFSAFQTQSHKTVRFISPL